MKNRGGKPLTRINRNSLSCHYSTHKNFGEIRNDRLGHFIACQKTGDYL